MTDFKHDRTALIDGDIIVYRSAAYAHDHQQDELELQERIVHDIHDWTDRAFCSDFIVCLSCSRDDNFRRLHWPLYKTQRPDERPEFHGMAIDILREFFEVFQRNNLEADDCMGLLATLGTIENPVMVSIDKDLRTVPGWHFNPNKEDFPVLVTYEQADRAFMRQWLSGDRTDGYHGIKGMGEKKAEKVLTGPMALWEARVLNEYMVTNCTYEYALSMARCARILRSEDWDTLKKEVIPWTPTAGALEGLEDWVNEESCATSK